MVLACSLLLLSIFSGNLGAAGPGSPGAGAAQRAARAARRASPPGAVCAFGCPCGSQHSWTQDLSRGPLPLAFLF